MKCPACWYEGSAIPHPMDGRESRGIMCYGKRKGASSIGDQARAAASCVCPDTGAGLYSVECSVIPHAKRAFDARKNQDGRSKRVATADAIGTSVPDVRTKGKAARVAVRVSRQAPDASGILPEASEGAAATQTTIEEQITDGATVTTFGTVTDTLTGQSARFVDEVAPMPKGLDKLVKEGKVRRASTLPQPSPAAKAALAKIRAALRRRAAKGPRRATKRR